MTDARTRSEEAMREATVALTEAQDSAARLKKQTQRSSTEELAQARLEAMTLRSRAQIAFSDPQNRVESILRSAQQEAKNLTERAPSTVSPPGSYVLAEQVSSSVASCAFDSFPTRHRCPPAPRLPTGRR